MRCNLCNIYILCTYVVITVWLSGCNLWELVPGIYTKLLLYIKALVNSRYGSRYGSRYAPGTVGTGRLLRITVTLRIL